MVRRYEKSIGITKERSLKVTQRTINTGTTALELPGVKATGVRRGGGVGGVWGRAVGGGVKLI